MPESLSWTNRCEFCRHLIYAKKFAHCKPGRPCEKRSEAIVVWFSTDKPTATAGLLLHFSLDYVALISCTMELAKRSTRLQVVTYFSTNNQNCHSQLNARSIFIQGRPCRIRTFGILASTKGVKNEFGLNMFPFFHTCLRVLRFY